MRNVSLKTVQCEENDIIIITTYCFFFTLFLTICSDGVYDNFDPEMLGIPPSELSSEFATIRWSQKEYAEKLSSLKEEYICKKITDVIHGKFDAKMGSQPYFCFICISNKNSFQNISITNS